MVRSKSTVGITQVVPPRTFDELSTELLSAGSYLGPKDCGRVDLIVLRPKENAREVVEEVAVDVENGMHGSGWVKNEQRGLIDQICVMSSAAIRAIAGEDKQKWGAAGDQLFIDMNLCKENLKTAQRVRIGEVLMEVTPKAHNGCAKFSARYGIDALKVVNCPDGKASRLRGIYFSVIEAGIIRNGDLIVKVDG